MRQNPQYDYLRLYAKYLGLTFQMILIIVVGGFGGKALDRYFQLQTSVFTIILIIFAAILSFYLFFKTIFTK